MFVVRITCYFGKLFTSHLSCYALGFLLAILTGASTAEAAIVTVLRSVSSGGYSLTPLTQAPQINQHGQLTFLANEFDSRTGSVTRGTVWVGDGHTTREVDNGVGLNSITPPVPGINNQGQVAYYANLTTTARTVLTDIGGPRTQTFPGQAFGAAGTYSSFYGLAINDSGKIVAQAGQNGGIPGSNGGDQILAANVTNGPGGTTVSTGVAFTTDTSSGTPHFFSLGIPDLNSSGQIAFIGQDATAFRSTGLFIGTDQNHYVTAALANTSAVPGVTIVNGRQLIGMSGTPALNDVGDAAFRGITNNNQQGLFVYHSDTNSVTQAAAASSSLTDPTAFHNFAGVGLNNAGQVAFQASFGPASTQGIFTGADNHQVIAVGDLIGTERVDGLQFSSAINDAGQIGFYAHFTDGQSGIFRYDPPGSTPETALLPNSPVAGGFGFALALPTGDFGLGRSAPIFIDPIVAVGYDYQVTDGELFQSVLLPIIGDNHYSLQLWNGSGYGPSIALDGGMQYLFSSPLDRFRILGIETSAALDPNNPNAFVTGLTFSGSGNANVTMTPILFDTDAAAGTVPEPGSMLIWSLSALGCAFAGYRQRRTA